MVGGSQQTTACGQGRSRARWGIRMVWLLPVLALLVAAAPASASVSLKSFSISPSTTLAAAHPDVTISTSFSYSDSTDTVQSLQVYFPAGLIGNPSVVSQCTTAQLASDSCPAGSRIGSVSVTASALGLPLPVTAPGDVYNVTPTGSEPARIGMVVRPLGGVLGKFSLSGPVTLRIPGDEGLVSTFTNLPRSLPPVLGVVPIPITIQSISLTLNGLVNGGSAAFMTNPTSCSPAIGAAVATSYESSTQAGSFGGFTPTDCAHVPFTPGVSFSFGSTRANTPSSLDVTATVPAAELPRRQSHVEGNVVLLPLGTGINPAAFTGLVACTDAQLAVNSAAPATCPAASQVGTVAFATPLLGTLPGQVFFATGTSANPLRLFIQLNVKGLYAKLVANNSFFGPYIVSTLSNLPQVPFTSFTLSFSGGPNALVTTPPCGTAAGFGAFIPWSGTPNQVLTSSVIISQTSTGAPCPAAAGDRAQSAARIARDLRHRLAKLRPGRLKSSLTEAVTDERAALRAAGVARVRRGHIVR